MKKKANIRDVAERANVSVASVSYVVNGIDKVSVETKRRILDAIHEMDYKPSFMARGLSSGRSKLIGLTLPITESSDIPGDLLENNPFFGEFLSGLQNAMYNKDYEILLSCISTNAEYTDWIQKRGLDGIIMLGVYPKSLFKELQEMNVPVVLIDIYEDYASDFHCVRIDDELGGYLATRHLIDLGHTRIAFASGSIKNSRVNYFRYKGYARALNESNIPLDTELFFEDNATFNGGYRIGKTRLTENRKVTAIFAAADIMAIGLIKAAYEIGRKVPDELSIIGFDDIQFGKYIAPELTTIRQDIPLKSKVAAEMIIKDLNNHDRTKTSTILKPELIVRGSTSAIKY